MTIDEAATAWEAHFAAVRAKVRPGDIVEVLPNGKDGFPVILDLSHEPPGYRRGSHRCLRCGFDPYDPHCCRQQAMALT